MHAAEKYQEQTLGKMGLNVWKHCMILSFVLIVSCFSKQTNSAGLHFGELPNKCVEGGIAFWEGWVY